MSKLGARAPSNDVERATLLDFAKAVRGLGSSRGRFSASTWLAQSMVCGDGTGKSGLEARRR